MKYWTLNQSGRSIIKNYISIGTQKCERNQRMQFTIWVKVAEFIDGLVKHIFDLH